MFDGTSRTSRLHTYGNLLLIENMLVNIRPNFFLQFLHILLNCRRVALLNSKIQRATTVMTLKGNSKFAIPGKIEKYIFSPQMKVVECISTC